MNILIVIWFLTTFLSFSNQNKSIEVVTQFEIETNSNQIRPTNKLENGEQKAVRLAEEFVKVNGYTDVPADKNKISYESIEFTNNIDKLLFERRNSLESKAFGLLNESKGGKGWTVVFRYKKLPLGKYGRAVTMDENFKHLKVEHKEFILKFVKKKLNNERLKT